jgi:hypothetical protein
VSNTTTKRSMVGRMAAWPPLRFKVFLWRLSGVCWGLSVPFEGDPAALDIRVGVWIPWKATAAAAVQLLHPRHRCRLAIAQAHRTILSPYP